MAIITLDIDLHITGTITVNMPDPPPGPPGWILADGAWNDLGVWTDTSVWSD